MSHRLEERLALNVTRRATHFDNGHFSVTRARHHPALDFIGDVGNDLHRAAEIVTSPLFTEHGVINPARREVICPAHDGAREPLIMTQIQIGLRAIVSHKNLTMLKRAHRARVNVDVRIQFEEGDFEPACLEHGGEGGGGDPLTQRGHNTTSNEHISRHGFHQSEKLPGRLF